MQDLTVAKRFYIRAYGALHDSRLDPGCKGACYLLSNLIKSRCANSKVSPRIYKCIKHRLFANSDPPNRYNVRHTPSLPFLRINRQNSSRQNGWPWIHAMQPSHIASINFSLHTFIYCQR